MKTSRTSRGASAVEYGLLIAGIAAVLAAAIIGFGGSIRQLTEDNCGTVTSYISNGADDAGCTAQTP